MAYREKSVSIPQSLFMDIALYMLFDDDRTEERFRRIQRGLDEKLDRIAEHDLYSKYKTAPTQEQKEKARQEYLDRKGIPQSFRWGENCKP